MGEGWPALWAAKEMCDVGLRPRVWSLSHSSSARQIPVYWGNGELWETARLIYGDAIAETLWEISQKNFLHAKKKLAELSVPISEEGLVWFASDEKQAKLLKTTAERKPEFSFSERDSVLSQGKEKFKALLKEPAFSFSGALMEKTLRDFLKRAKVSVETVEEIRQIQSKEVFEYELCASSKGEEKTISAPLVIFISSRISQSLLPSMRDKWMPVSLTSAFAEGPRPFPFSFCLFHGGADFASGGEKGIQLGSFRNLYEDKAVGILKKADPATLRGVETFFGSLGWISESTSLKTEIDVTSLSCDGLPLVGALPDFPGVYLLTGFAGREANFLFEVTRRLAQGLVKEKGFSSLAIFSTKRFV